jgi:hypothetical protein
MDWQIANTVTGKDPAVWLADHVTNYGDSATTVLLSAVPITAAGFKLAQDVI